jgi:hypothetical protein
VTEVRLKLCIPTLTALALYRATGFQPIPLFGEYCFSPETSVCLGKDLVDQDP